MIEKPKLNFQKRWRGSTFFEISKTFIVRVGGWVDMNKNKNFQLHISTMNTLTKEKSVIYFYLKNLSKTFSIMFSDAQTQKNQ